MQIICAGVFAGYQGQYVFVQKIYGQAYEYAGNGSA